MKKEEENNKIIIPPNSPDNVPVEIWTPTMLLRWQVRLIAFDTINSQVVLQQMWRNDKGEEQYRDIPIVE